MTFQLHRICVVIALCLAGASAFRVPMRASLAGGMGSGASAAGFKSAALAEASPLAVKGSPLAAKAAPLLAKGAALAPLVLADGAWYDNGALRGVVSFFTKGPGLLIVPVLGGVGIAGFIAGFIFFGSQPEEDQ